MSICIRLDRRYVASVLNVAYHKKLSVTYAG